MADTARLEYTLHIVSMSCVIHAACSHMRLAHHLQDFRSDTILELHPEQPLILAGDLTHKTHMLRADAVIIVLKAAAYMKKPHGTSSL